MFVLVCRVLWCTQHKQRPVRAHIHFVAEGAPAVALPYAPGELCSVYIGTVQTQCSPVSGYRVQSRCEAHSKRPHVGTTWGTNDGVGNLGWGSESEFPTGLLR